jgi:hypothetical protein
MEDARPVAWRDAGGQLCPDLTGCEPAWKEEGEYVSLGRRRRQTGGSGWGQEGGGQGGRTAECMARRGSVRIGGAGR